MKKLNVIWILIDSARNFKTDVDDRGLPASVEDFGREKVFFRNVVTSAPSTLMSVSSIMASLPSYLTSRNYNNFQDVSETFNTLPKILRENGYDIFGSIYFKHGREALSNLFGTLPNKFLPQGVSHKKKFWTNEDMYNIFLNITKKRGENPLFCYLHFNVRVDVNISETIGKTLSLIKSEGLLEDSIVIVDSDHGYPMPNRGWSCEEAQTKGLPHDLLLNNDNILTPLIFSYPGSPKGFLNNDFVSTLDIVPTILDLLSYSELNDTNFHGKSLVPLISGGLNENNRPLRCDNRYLAQPHRGSALIMDQKKLIVNRFPERNYYELFDLKVDPEEQSNIYKDNPSLAEKMRGIFDQTEKDFIDFHYQLLLKRWSSLIEKKFERNSIRTVCVYISDEPCYEKLFIKAFSNIFKNAKISVKSRALSLDNKVFKGSRVSWYDGEVGEFDLVVGAINTEAPWDNSETVSRYKKIPAKNYIFPDNNGLIYFSSPTFRLVLNYFRRRFRLFIRDPKSLIDLIRRVIKRKGLGDATSRARNTIITSESFTTDAEKEVN